MDTDLLRVSIRQGAVFIPRNEQISGEQLKLTPATAAFVTRLQKVGYIPSEELLHALNAARPTYLSTVLETLNEILGTGLNWASLVKGWDTPTGESVLDHVITLFANLFNSEKGVRLPCGHLIPENTFPLERYNGCPFCGTPFILADTCYTGQASKLKTLRLWKEQDIDAFYTHLLESKTALDATQADSLKILLKARPLPHATITMKETSILVIDALVEDGKSEEAQSCFSTPNDILRYLWFKKTGFLQIIEPKTLLRKANLNNTHLHPLLDQSRQAAIEKKKELKLRYNRRECRDAATWLNHLDMPPEQACEIMHPKRGMWIRFIRALRLAEYARKKGFERLRTLLDVFYNQNYTVWQGEVNRYRLKVDARQTFALLKQRPGLFARSLFSNMLWFGPEETLAAFREVLPKLPARLLFTLSMYAQNYFDPEYNRVVKPLGGNSMSIPPHSLLKIYDDQQLKEMATQVKELCHEAVYTRFAQQPTEHKSMYIDPMLYHIPLSIGDRSDTVQDASCALQGTRFPIEGSQVRLFMQWGKGLPAQPLDMDLSCYIAFPHTTEVCSYFNLHTAGAGHSGDIRNIPDRVGTAEYIELDLDELNRIGAQYVIFTCNAYSNGALSPELVVGWMNSAYPMQISEANGVAYDPSCVQHQIRVSHGLAKGLAFGILEVEKREITWLEMPFGGQNINTLNANTLENLLAKLRSKTTIGELLEIKARAQQLSIEEKAENTDEVYDIVWAMNTAGVTQLLVGG